MRDFMGELENMAQFIPSFRGVNLLREAIATINGLADKAIMQHDIMRVKDDALTWLRSESAARLVRINAQQGTIDGMPITTRFKDATILRLRRENDAQRAAKLRLARLCDTRGVSIERLHDENKNLAKTNASLATTNKFNAAVNGQLRAEKQRQADTIVRYQTEENDKDDVIKQLRAEKSRQYDTIGLLFKKIAFLEDRIIADASIRIKPRIIRTRVQRADDGSIEMVDPDDMG